VAILSLLFCVTIVCFGLGKMLAVNKWIMLAVLTILVIACFSANAAAPTPRQTTGGIVYGIWQALLYAGLNCCMFETMFDRALERFPRRRVLSAALWATGIVCVLIVLILSAIYRTDMTAEMPILGLSDTIITRGAVFLCILTSQMICLFNLTAPVTKKWRPTAAISISILGFSFGLFGFRNVIGAAYPVVGGFMVAYVVLNFIGYLRRRRGVRLGNRGIVNYAVNGRHVEQNP
jgi:uncharacterized membrane protein YkvI